MWMRIVVWALLLIFSYFLGQAHCQNQVVTQQIEVIKYVKTKQAEIVARPHAAKPELLKLMRDGKL